MRSPRRPRRSTARWGALPAALAATALVLVGCTSEPEPMPTPTPEPSPTPFRTAAPSGDGAFVVGTLLPTARDLSGVAAAQIAAVEVAVRELNDAGGVLGAPVTVFHRDSGTEPGEQLEAALADLIDRGADVVIGPFTGELVAQAIPLAAEAGVALISTGAVGEAERELDTAGVFARVVPTDRLQGDVLATAALADGAEALAVVASDDATGTEIAAGVADAAERAGVDAPQVVTVTASTAVSAAAEAAEADAVIVAVSAALADTTGGMLEALLDAGVAPASLWLASDAAANYSDELGPGALEGARAALRGAVPDEAFVDRLVQADPALTRFRGAPEAYDAVLLAALAATVLEDDGGATIMAGLPQVARDGAPCTSYGECLQFLIDEPDAGLNYEGRSGSLGMTVAGDIDEPVFGLGVYTDENRAVRDGTLSLD